MAGGRKNSPKVVCVKVPFEESERFDSMMGEKDYFRFCRMGENNIYVKNRYRIDLLHAE